MGTVVRGDFARSNSKGVKQAGSDKPVHGYQLKLGVAFSDPLIWRILRVPGSMTLAELHEVIQVCMGWNDVESHQFLVGKIFYQPESTTDEKPEYNEADFQLFQLEEGMQFLFTYLYGAGSWELEIAVEEVIDGGVEADGVVVLDGRGGCPPEDVGDIHAYQVLLSMADGSNKRLPDYPDFDPAYCNVDEINELLRTIRKG